MVEYILLDCRTKKPQKAYPGRDRPLKLSVIETDLSFTAIANLFHVVFEDEFKQVIIFDNKLEHVEDFLL